MSALLTRSPTHESGHHTERGPTLDEVVTRAWEVLRAGLPATCPACGGDLVPRPAAGSSSAGGRCDDCGATLS